MDNFIRGVGNCTAQTDVPSRSYSYSATLTKTVTIGGSGEYSGRLTPALGHSLGPLTQIPADEQVNGPRGVKRPCSTTDTPSGESQTPPAARQFRIVYGVPAAAMEDEALRAEFENITDLDLATMVRDLHALITHHTGSMADNSIFPIMHISAPGPDVIRKNTLVTQGLPSVLTRLAALLDVFNVCLEDPLNKPVPLGPSRAPYVVEFKLDGAWPRNMHRVYLSRLVCRHTGCSGVLPHFQLDTADYCLAVHATFRTTEEIFESTGVKVLRRDLKSMDYQGLVAPVIVRAWELVCLGSWKVVNKTHRACLRLVTKNMPNEREANVVQTWIDWLRVTETDIHKAEMVCVPLCMDDHYTLLLINFRSRRIQCIDSKHATDHSAWDNFATTTVNQFWELLGRLSDERHGLAPKFTYEVLHPHWSTTIPPSDSGVTTMQLIDQLGEPGCHLSTIRLHEEHVRVISRIQICASIVISMVNQNRGNVMDKVQEFVARKNAGVIQPSPEIASFRRLYASSA